MARKDLVTHTSLHCKVCYSEVHRGNRLPQNPTARQFGYYPHHGEVLLFEAGNPVQNLLLLLLRHR